MRYSKRLQNGWLMTLLGLAIWSMALPNLLRAATSYRENWRATQYRAANISLASGSGGATGDYCLGPSEWSVEGQVGDQQFSETWQVLNPTRTVTGAWVSSWPISSAHTRKVTYTFTASCNDDASLDSTTIDTRLTTIGLYGGLATIRDGGGLDNWNLQTDILGVRSMPKVWHIEGITR
jgi:hypothetical protein